MSIEADFNRFLEFLIQAAAKIDSHYFQLPVAGGENPIFRERVYCYELYHQLRCAMDDYFPYKLDGEVDKSGHPILRTEICAKKPDFIVHVPGQMESNLVVMEVKPVNAKLGEIVDDLTTLDRFLRKAKYHYAIMLVYGNVEHDLPPNFNVKTEGWLKTDSEKKRFLWHQGPRVKPVIIE